MQTGRRQFIAGLLATGLAPKPTWADAGSPSFLSAAALQDGSYVLCGIDDALHITFQIPLPSRGHAAAAHPCRPQAVAFARRPGTFAVVIDCITSTQKAALNAPRGRHFYGHGVFSSCGDLLYTTENDYESGRGRIGVWDVTSGYSRIDEWDSGGIGPHDIKRLPDSDVLVIANGGIDTHPDSGRTKLNIPSMQPNLFYTKHGAAIECAELPPHMSKNSIRHLAVSPDGRVAFGMQWQGDKTPGALVGEHVLGKPIQLMQCAAGDLRDMQGYVGSIAYSFSGRTIAVTSPRGGKTQLYDTAAKRLSASQFLEDVCGVACTTKGFLFSSGTGELRCQNGPKTTTSRHEPVTWDNHLIVL